MVHIMNRQQTARQISRVGNISIPLWCHWYAKETEEKYGTDLDNLKIEYPDDIIMAEFLPAKDQYAPHPYWFGGLDEFGCRWVKAATSVGGQIKSHPLKKLDHLDQFITEMKNEIYAQDRNRFEQAETLRQQHPDTYIVVKLFRLFFERLHFWRGMDHLFIDLYTEMEKIIPLMHFLTDFIIHLIDGCRDADADAVFIGDDWGFQNQMMINPDFWREHFKPLYSKIFNHIQAKKMQAWYHSCGQITPIIPDLIETGVMVLNPLQAHAMDLSDLARFRGALTFQGGFDSQQLLHDGTEDQMQQAITHIIQSVHTPSGGYIGGPDGTIMPEIPLSQIEHMCRAFRHIPRK